MILFHYLPDTTWALPLEMHAIWDFLSTRGFPAQGAKVIEELTGIEVMVEAFITVGYGERYKVLYDHD